MQSIVLVLVAALGCGCGARANGPGTLQLASDEVRADAAKSAKELQKEIYGSVRRGKLDGLQNLIAEEFFAVGPAAGQRYEGREPAFLAIANGFERAKHRLSSKGLRSTASPGAKSAWVTDEIDLDRVRYRVTSVYSEVDEIWVARSSFMTRAGAASAVPTLPAGHDFKGVTDAAAQEVVELLAAALADAKVLEGQWAAHKGVTLIGPGKKDLARGKRGITKLWKKLVEKTKWQVEMIGEPRARLTSDLGLCWIATAADARTEDGQHRALQAFAVYSQADEGWRLEVLHLAVAP